MHLLIAMADRCRAEQLRMLLYSRWEGWQAALCSDGRAVVELLRTGETELLLLALPDAEAQPVWRFLQGGQLLCPPRVLLLCPEGDLGTLHPDCTAHPAASPAQLCRLLEALAKKPLPHLAGQMQQRLAVLVESFLNDLGMPAGLKGRGYAAWLLVHSLPCRRSLPMGEWYRRCAAAHGTTPWAVERCLRLAVEDVFTQGSIQAIERCFGATVDPEKGKPTNRAFLRMAVAYLRYSFTDTRSLNSSEMHHSPAAPTSV